MRYSRQDVQTVGWALWLPAALTTAFLHASGVDMEYVLLPVVCWACTFLILVVLSAGED